MMDIGLVSWQQEVPRHFTSKIKNLAVQQSLTGMLKKRPHIFSVQLLALKADKATEHGIFSQEHSTWMREVFLCLDGVPVVQARSECLNVPDSPWLSMLDRGESPLGQTLFGTQAPTFQRTPFEYNAEPLSAPIYQQCCTPDALRYCRRSVFQLNGHALLMMESFLPQIERFM